MSELRNGQSRILQSLLSSSAELSVFTKVSGSGTWTPNTSALLGSGTPLGFSATGSAGTGTFAAREDHIHPGNVADWTNRRYFAVDYENGIDTNLGWSDVSLSGAALTPKKTWEGFLSVLPLNGNGKQFEVGVKPRLTGSTYRNAANTADASIGFGARKGYASAVIRGTDTIASANSVAFSGSIDDEITVGAQTLSGTNVTGYKLSGSVSIISGATNTNPVSIWHDGQTTYTAGEMIFIPGLNSDFHTDSDETFYTKGLPHIRQIWRILAVPDSTHITLSGSNAVTFRQYVSGALAGVDHTITRIKVTTSGGAAPSLTVEPALLGRRLRGDFATTTVANRNAVRSILANGTDTVVLDTDITTLSPNDIWYIEEPAAAFVSVTDLSVADTVNMTGIKTTTGGINADDASLVTIAFCVSNSLVAARAKSLSTSNIYRNILGTNRTAGSPRSTGVVTVSDSQQCALTRIYVATSLLTLSRILNYAIGPACYLGGGMSLVSCGTAGAAEGVAGVAAGVPQIGGSIAGSIANRTTRPVRMRRAATTGNVFTITSSHGFFSGIQLENPTSNVAGSAIIATGLGMTLLFDMIGDQRRTHTPTGPQGGGLRLQRTSTSAIGFLSKSVELRGRQNNNSFAEICVDPGFTTNSPGTDGSAFRSIDVDLSDIKDQNLTRVFSHDLGQNQPAGNAYDISLQNPSSFLTGNDIFSIPFYIARTDPNSGSFPFRSVEKAQADSIANASVITGVCTSTDAGSRLAVQNSGLCWVITDTRVNVGDLLYLSTATAGQAMNTIPVNNGTNAKLRLGHAHLFATYSQPDTATVVYYALINLNKIEMLPALADGLL